MTPRQDQQTAREWLQARLDRIVLAPGERLYTRAGPFVASEAVAFLLTTNIDDFDGMAPGTALLASLDAKRCDDGWTQLYSVVHRLQGHALRVLDSDGEHTFPVYQATAFQPLNLARVRVPRPSPPCTFPCLLGISEVSP